MTEMLEKSDKLERVGRAVAVVRGPDGEIKQRVETKNLITQIGDQYYSERAAGITSPPGQVTGMRLGTSNATAAAKTGAGAAIVAYLTGSQKAIDSGFPTSGLNGSSRRITWRCTWAAAVATSNTIWETVLTNEASLTDVAGTAANTIARIVWGTVIQKGANDSLEITLYHDALGA